MPRKKINRSQAIRDYLAKNAGASVEIKEALAKQGIKASDTERLGARVNEGEVDERERPRSTAFRSSRSFR